MNTISLHSSIRIKTVKPSPLNNRRYATRRTCGKPTMRESTLEECPVYATGRPLQGRFLDMHCPRVLRTPGYWEETALRSLNECTYYNYLILISYLNTIFFFMAYGNNHTGFSFLFFVTQIFAEIRRNSQKFPLFATLRCIRYDAALFKLWRCGV